MENRDVTLEVTIVIRGVESNDSTDACTLVKDDLQTRFPDNWEVIVNNESCQSSE